LLANEDATLQFLEQPHKFSNLHIDFKRIRSKAPTPDDTCVQNTTYRMDEPSNRLLREALKLCSKLRPKHFGVSAAESAAIFVGLYLKAKNPTNNSVQHEFYDKALANFLQNIVVRKKRLQFAPLQTDICNINNILDEIIASAIE
jgi:hypothetical protein